MNDPAVIVRPIRTRRERAIFLRFPWQVYRGDRMWVPPVLSERASRVDPARGAFFKHGEAEFFLAWRGGKPVGTICAGVDHRRNEFQDIQEGLFGFFDCVPDYDAAHALFDAAAAWARERGQATLWGPFHLDYEDAYGILIEGYDRPPAILCGHTPPYYREFVERYGFEPARGDNVAVEARVEHAWSPEAAKLQRVAEIARKRGRVTVRGERFDRWDEEMEKVLKILNAGLAVLPGSTPWAVHTFAATARALLPYLDPDLILIGEVDGEPVGWLPGVPNFNEALYHANGLRFPWDYASLWCHMRQRPDCLSVKSIAVVPEYWGRGVDALMLAEMGSRAESKGYRWIDFSLTETTNPMTIKLASRLGARVYKRYRVYRKRV